MKGKIIILCAVVAILGVIYFVKSQPPAPAKSEGKFLALDFDKVTGLTLAGKDRAISLVKVGDKWRLEKPISYLAEQAMVNNFINELKNMPAGEVISSDEKKYGRFETDEAGGTKVTLLNDKKEVQAEFLVGKSSPDNTLTYIRKKNSKDVVMLAGRLNAFAKRQVDDLRDKAIIDFEPGQLAGVSFAFPDEQFGLALKDKDWQVVKNGKTQPVVNKPAVEALISLLSKFKTSEFHKKPAEVDFKAPDLTLSLILKDKSEKKLQFKADEKKEKYFVKVDNQEPVFIVYKQLVAGIFNKFQDYLEIKEPAAAPGMMPGAAVPPGEGQIIPMRPGSQPGPIMGPGSQPGPNVGSVPPGANAGPGARPGPPRPAMGIKPGPAKPGQGVTSGQFGKKAPQATQSGQ
ncbi:MAG: DUF4340 domain-containing protein [Deltaproteobacteria bacterium]|nr:DUF4340 domain-containing protein [Deltaproteobacteria bacterium]MBF0523511.1 DUF4340 domain-containing protein [Deltaproteobacteria bacterium]